MKIIKCKGEQKRFSFYLIVRDKQKKGKKRRERREHKRAFDSPRKNGRMALIRFESRNRVLNAIRNYRKELVLWENYARTADNRGQRIHAWGEVERIQNALDDLIEFTTC